MKKKYILAIDSGTTSVRSIIFDHSGAVRAMAQREITQIYPRPGWVEHSAEEIWEKQLATARDAIRSLGATAEDIAALGITNQRETAIVWDRITGKPVYNAIVWQCRRSAEYCDSLKNDSYGDMIREKTGLVPDAYFSGPKIRWILENTDGLRRRAERGELCFGTVDTWLIWKLTGGKSFVTDYSNASRTMLFNIHTLEWDEDLCRILNIPMSILPEVVPSSSVMGMCEPSVFGAPVPISGVAGDQQAALFGQCCFSKGEVKNTYGTGCFTLMNIGEEAVASKNGLVTTIAWGLEKNKVSYALEGSVFVAGAAVQWLRDEMGLIKSSAESEECAAAVEDTGGCYFVPAFTGLGAPYWDQDARGVICGMTRGTGKNHLIRAVLESIAYQSLDVLGAMENDSGLDIEELKVDGGASSNNLLMQFQADIMGGRVIRPECVETTARGAAFMAGLAVGFWSGTGEISKLSSSKTDVFCCAMSKERRDMLLHGWHAALRRTLS